MSQNMATGLGVSREGKGCNILWEVWEVWDSKRQWNASTWAPSFLLDPLGSRCFHIFKSPSEVGETPLSCATPTGELRYEEINSTKHLHCTSSDVQMVFREASFAVRGHYLPTASRRSVLHCDERLPPAAFASSSVHDQLPMSNGGSF